MAGKKKNGLGKGLDALFIDNSMEDTSGAINVSINEIEPNRDQPRKVFKEEALKELSESISLHGVIQPLLVRPLSDGGYQLIAGERRWRASRMAGLTEVPVVVREMSDSEAMELALIENLQREDLNPVEEAKGYELLMKTFSLTQEEVAERVGKSRPAVTNAMRLLTLSEKVLDMLSEGKISAGHAKALLGLKDKAQMEILALEIYAKSYSVRQTEAIVKSLNSPKSEKPKKKSLKDPYFEECELALKNELQRKASIVSGKGKGGKIEIEFYDKEDLGKIMKLFSKW